MTSSTLREQITQVLRQHWVNCQIYGHRAACTCRMDPILSDLLSCVPHPSRDALERLWQQHDRQYPSAEAWRAAMKEALMAWATGQPSTPVWCVHWTWDPAVFIPWSGGAATGAWKRSCGKGYVLAGEDTRFCDRCDAKRPEEPT
mgnify:CR=1 FL=1